MFPKGIKYYLNVILRTGVTSTELWDTYPGPKMDRVRKVY